MRILLIENDKLQARTLQDLLTTQGFQVEVAYDGETGVEFAMLGIYDLLILDAMLPGFNGCQVTRQLRSARCTVPILMVSEKCDVSDRIEGLNVGADYFLAKPFDSRELLACIHALLRRQGAQVNNLTFGDIELDLSTCLLHCGDKKVRLTAKEFDVLRHLMRSGEKLIPKEVLLARVWGLETNAIENHVEVYMAFLRKKLRGIGSKVQISAIRRMGYHLELTDE